MKNDLRRLLASLGDLAGPHTDTGVPGRAGRSTHTGGVGDADACTAQDLDVLVAAQQALAEPHTFKPGMLVRWKRTAQGLSLANRTRPRANEMAVVTGVLSTPLQMEGDDVNSGSPVWHEALNLQLGVIDDGDFLVLHFDSARFEPMSVHAARQQAGRHLRELQVALQQRHPLLPGMLVRWKPLMKNRKWPAVGQAAVVLEVLPEPCIDPTMPGGSQYFREPLDVVLGLILDGEFQTMHTDSRRLEPVAGAASKTAERT